MYPEKGHNMKTKKIKMQNQGFAGKIKVLNVKNASKMNMNLKVQLPLKIQIKKHVNNAHVD